MDEFGATHTFTFYQQGIYGVEVRWEKSDLLLGIVEVASASEVTFFDSEGIEACYAIVSWESPVGAYGVFHHTEQAIAGGNDELALEIYRYVTQGAGAESSRDNFRLSMALTRQPEEA